MAFRKLLIVLVATAWFVASNATALPALAASPSGTNLTTYLVGSTSLKAATRLAEIRPGDDTILAAVTPAGRRIPTDRRLTEPTAATSTLGPSVAGTVAGPPTTGLGPSWEGLNHFDHRYGSSAGNDQYNGEPPDQGLCAGNGYVFESVNSVIAVYSTTGTLLSGPTAINEFYGYRVAYNRTTGVPGPDVPDPSCYFDTATQRWFQVATALAVDDAGNYTGKTSIDIAVSATSSPIGAWNLYRVATQNDGTDGTPNHGCAGGPCLPDYPHIGADANGFYVTANEFPFFADGYRGVDVYSLSKNQLAAGNATVTTNLIFIEGFVENAYTVWPAQSPGSRSFATGAGGTEYLLSSDASFNEPHSSSQVFLWALTNTASLNGSPALQLKKAIVPVAGYADPPPSTQKAGDTPLRDCINDTSLVVPGQGRGCWRFFFAPQDQPAHDEAIELLDSHDSGMQQVTYADGKVWGALDTAVSGLSRAGIAWYEITPSLSRLGVLSGRVAAQGTVAATNGNNVIFPALAVTAGGKGVIAFTLVGPDYFPSAAYVTMTPNGTSPIRIAQAGADSQDGWNGYKAFGEPPRPRWGDYGAAAVDGNSIWIGSEYIATSCTYNQWLSSNFLCGNSRTALANWSTRISKVTP